MGCELSKVFTRQNRIAPLDSPLHRRIVSKSKRIGVDNSDVASNLHKCDDGQEEATIMLSGDSDDQSLFSITSMEIPVFDADSGDSVTSSSNFKNPDIKSYRSYHTPPSSHTPNLVKPNELPILNYIEPLSELPILNYIETLSTSPLLNYIDTLKRKNDGTSTSQLCSTSSIAETLVTISSDDRLTPLSDQERRVAKRNRPYAAKRRRVFSPWTQTAIGEILAPGAFEKGNDIVTEIDSEATDTHTVCKPPKAVKGPRRPMQPMIMPTGHKYLNQSATRSTRVGQQGVKICLGEERQH